MASTAQMATVAASLALAATFVGWRVHATRTHPNVQVEIVKDPSRSTTDGCESLIGLAEGTLAVDGVSAKSTLTVILVGDAATANEPTLLASYAMPFSTKVVEARNASRRRQARLLGDLLAKCRAARRTDVSPIFLAVKQAIADLRSRGCNMGSHCELLVDSDLEENGEPAIRSRLDGVANEKPLPAVLDNSEIAVSFCGLAATGGGVVRDPNREDRLRLTWRSLFSAQDLVSFKPYCPTSSVLAGNDATMPSTAHSRAEKP